MLAVRLTYVQELFLAHGYDAAVLEDKIIARLQKLNFRWYNYN